MVYGNSCQKVPHEYPSSLARRPETGNLEVSWFTLNRAGADQRVGVHDHQTSHEKVLSSPKPPLAQKMLQIACLMIKVAQTWLTLVIRLLTLRPL